MLLPLRFQPGINREYTAFTNEAGWRDCDKVRFRAGFPETIGGWTRASDETFDGICRNIFSWGTLDGEILLGLGTHLKYYILDAGVFNNITPIRETTAAGDVTFSASAGSATITVTDTAHGATINSFVTFSGAASLGGNITADVLNQEYQITSVLTANTYTIDAKDTNGDPVLANGSDTGNGGASTVGAYQINAGLQDETAGVGWGADAWGAGGWGDAGTSAVSFLGLRVWSHDNFGEDLVINPRDGNIYYWDATLGTSSRAVALSTLSGASDCPTVASCILTSDQDRHMIAFGCDPITDPTVQDPLLIRWSDQENIADWTPRTTNTAGDLRISTGSTILAAIQTKREIVIFTDVSLHSMQFIGPPYTFGLQEIGRSAQLIGVNAAVNVKDVIYYMAEGKFMVYDGTIQEIPCTVKEYVFNRLDSEQQAKTVAAHNGRFSEVWWFYQSTDADEIDSYVVYNYEQGIWYYGMLNRTAWLDTGLFSYPLATDSNGKLYFHEFGLDDGSTNPPGPIHFYIESSGTDLENGDSFFFMHRVIPDITFRNSTSGSPAVTMTIKGREFPGANYDQSDDETVTQTATTPVERFTNQVFVRVRGRAFAFRIESNEAGVAWRLGTPRVDVRTDGRR